MLFQLTEMDWLIKKKQFLTVDKFWWSWWELRQKNNHIHSDQGSMKEKMFKKGKIRKGNLFFHI